MSITRSRTTGNPGRGRTTIVPLPLFCNVDKGVIHAKPFLPFMLTPSEPHTPSRHERRNESEGSCSFNNKSASRTIMS